MKKSIVWHNGTVKFSYQKGAIGIVEDCSLSTFFDMLVVLFKRK